MFALGMFAGAALFALGVLLGYAIATMTADTPPRLGSFTEDNEYGNVSVLEKTYYGPWGSDDDDPA